MVSIRIAVCIAMAVAAAEAFAAARHRRGNDQQGAAATSTTGGFVPCEWLGKTFQKGQQQEIGHFVYECVVSDNGKSHIAPIGCKVDGVLHKNGDKFIDGRFYNLCVITSSPQGDNIREDLVACVAKDGSEKKPGETWPEVIAFEDSKKQIVVQCRGDANYMTYGPV